MRFPTHRPDLQDPDEVFAAAPEWCPEEQRRRACTLRRTLPELARWNDTELNGAWQRYARAGGTVQNDLNGPPCNTDDFRMYLMALTLAPRLSFVAVTDDRYLEVLDLLRSLKPRVRAAARRGGSPDRTSGTTRPDT